MSEECRFCRVCTTRGETSAENVLFTASFMLHTVACFIALSRLSLAHLRLMQPSKSNGTGLLWVWGTVMMSSVSCHQWQEKKFALVLFMEAVQMFVKVLWLLINIRKIHLILCILSSGCVSEFEQTLCWCVSDCVCERLNVDMSQIEPTGLLSFLIMYISGCAT